MERIKALDWYQKCVLLVMAVMALGFGVVYSVTISRVGYAYKDTILLPSQENGSTVYDGEYYGNQIRFTVSPEKAVTFRYGSRHYGPYTAKEDPSAIPEEEETADMMTGVEIRNGEEILFRGGVAEFGGYRWLYNEDGTLGSLIVSVGTVNGVAWDGDGKEIDPLAPSADTILDLMAGPALTHKGDWTIWILGVCICLVTAVSILFAEELFRWNLTFQIRNADYAEPSDWELASRYIGWTVMPIAVLILFVRGLQ